MKRFKLNFTALALASLTLMSCNDFLDTLPDNRAEIDTEEEVKKLLTSAYPETECLLMGETMSDNVDDYGENNPYTDKFYDQLYHWQDVTEVSNESPLTFWRGQYAAIASANQALASIDAMAKNGELSDNLKKARAEALLCRAYAHFMLINIFCNNYNSQTSSTDLGLPYEVKPETKIYPEYERGTVLEDYDKIEQDILAALPDVSDSYQTVPRYHWGKRSANAFAARYYLYREQWDKAEKYATACLGSNPTSMLRDWKSVSQMTIEYKALVNDYISANHSCNLLLQTAYSVIGLACGPYKYYTRYSHGRYLADNETGLTTQNLWGNDKFYSPMQVYNGTNFDRTLFYKLPYKAEIIDATAGTGYFRTVYPVITADEVLLIRAEARIMQKNFAKAAEDLTAWMQNIVNTDKVLTPEGIKEHFANLPYAYEGEFSNGTDSQIKKHLHPAFLIDAEGSTQESMLQALLSFRRIETLEQGLRWFDIRRYGIVIPRRLMGADGSPLKVTDWLKVDDPRRTIQIPSDIQQAGFPANPR